MQETGVRNGAFGADKFGLKNLKQVHWNLGAPQLYQYSLSAGEAVLSADGALCADTGEFTGRSPKDKFTVRDATTDKKMWWAGNQSITAEQFETLYQDFLKHAEGKSLFAQDLYGGADPAYRIKTRVFTELAWHSLFIRTLLIRPEAIELSTFTPELTIIDMPSFRADPKRHGCKSENVVAIDFARKIVLIGGSYYAGEMKKSVFTTLNYYLPERGVMPMHCSANVGAKDDAAIFFGLSGTGKTTLSADPNRTLIGDDEHGWGPNGVFNFEGGCYAKCIKLSQEAEPQIYAASTRFGAVLENCVLDEDTRVVDFDDGSKTENTRSAYPLDFIPNASRTGRAPQPKNVVMLAADAFGVLPPIAKLSPAAGDVSLPLRLHRQGRGHRARSRQRAAAGVLDLLRLALPAARSIRLRQHAARPDRPAQCRLLAGQHRLDRRQVWYGLAHADQGDARAAHRGARRFASQRRIPHRQIFRLRGSDRAAGRAERNPQPGQHLEGQGRVRQDRPRAGRHVPEELCQVRSPGRRRSARSRAGREARGGVRSHHLRMEKGGREAALFVVCRV
ncbi:hypothetical protein ACVILJ_005609 [Bradyrhizobium diazoefficiens]